MKENDQKSFHQKYGEKPLNSSQIHGTLFLNVQS